MTILKELDYIYESPFPELPVRCTLQWNELLFNSKSEFTLWNLSFTLGKGKLRVTVSADSNKLERATIKNRSRNHLLTFGGMLYDCRVSISTEVQVPLPPQGLPPTFEMKRHKVQSAIRYFETKEDELLWGKHREKRREEKRRDVHRLIRFFLASMFFWKQC
jgi:hypothetical protein